jgi:hypothetical protein
MTSRRETWAGKGANGYEQGSTDASKRVAGSISMNYGKSRWAAHAAPVMSIHVFVVMRGLQQRGP